MSAWHLCSDGVNVRRLNRDRRTVAGQAPRRDGVNLPPIHGGRVQCSHDLIVRPSDFKDAGFDGTDTTSEHDPEPTDQFREPGTAYPCVPCVPAFRRR